MIFFFNKAQMKLAIIGAGFIANEHLKVITAIPGLKVGAILSRTRAKAERLQRKYDIPYVLEDLEELKKDVKKFDGILILVSAENLYPVSEFILKLNKPTFIEKPPGLTLQESTKLSNLAKKYQTPNMVGFNRRFYSIFHKGLKEIERKGSLLGFNITGHERFWNIKKDKYMSKIIKDNWLFANASHTFDLINFFGGELEQYSLQKYSLSEEKGDQFSLNFSSKSGAIGNYSSHWFSPGGWSVTLFGEGITVIFNPLEEGYYLDENFKKTDLLPSKKDKLYKPGLYDQMMAFKNLIKTGKLEWPAVSIQDSLTTLSLVDRVGKS
jgi:predicted dehydrogenase